MALFNQFSFLLLVGGIVPILLVVLWRWRRANPLLRVGILAWYVLAVLVVLLVWRYPASPHITTPADVETLLNAGRPTLVMLYSNY